MTAGDATTFCAAALLRASLHGSVAVAVLWLVSTALPRLPPAWRCWLWRGATAKLLLSLAIPVAVVLPMLPAGLSTPPGDSNVRPSKSVHDTPSTFITPALPDQTSPIIHAEPPAPEERWTLAVNIVVAAWAAGVVVSAVLVVRAHLSVLAMRRAAKATSDPGLLETCAGLCQRLGIDHTPQLLLSPMTDSPALVGGLRPAILLPMKQASSTSRDDLRMMLAHELAHVKRHDLWWIWLPVAARAVLWFHPLAWLACRELRLAQESACDAMAMSITGATPRCYGVMLLDVIESVRSNCRFPKALAAPVADTRRSVERRLAAMSHFNPIGPSRPATAGTVAAAIALVLALVPWRLAAQPSAREAPARSDDVAPAAAAPASRENPVASPGAAGGGAPGFPDAPPPDAMQFMGVVGAPTLSLGVASGGVVADVPVSEGDAVKAGQLIARVDDTAARAALVEAEAGLQLKQAQLKRLAELRRQNSTTDAELQAAEAELRIAEARIAAARNALQATRVVAPCDGVVSDVAIRPGELAGNGSVLAKLVDLSKLSLSFDLPDQYLPKVKVGQRVKVTVQSVPDETFDATIATIAPVVHSGSGTVTVRARLGDTKGLVRPGMTGSVKLAGAK
jgi:multidrug efflux pump subunit AcrA (membrane-fusion protein)